MFVRYVDQDRYIVTDTDNPEGETFMALSREEAITKLREKGCADPEAILHEVNLVRGVYKVPDEMVGKNTD